MKPGNYNPSQDPNAVGQVLNNPFVTSAGSIIAQANPVHLGEALAGRLGTIKGVNQQVGDQAARANEVVRQFAGLTGQNTYGPIDAAMRSAGEATNTLYRAIAKAAAALKVR